MTSCKQELAEQARIIEAWLQTALRTSPLRDGLPRRLREAMEYSLLAGGKRIRPVLCLASARLFCEQTSSIVPFACAFEFIHTYSLIHDDLPAMDNDDLRRGMPSSHKRFSEATAILAGDALLTDAFALISSGEMAEAIPAERLIRAIHCLSRAAGSAGMVGGQFYDMEYTGNGEIDLQTLAQIHTMKTGALLTAPCQCGAILSGASQSDIDALGVYGQALGTAFQITDDILDITGTEEELGKPVGSDAQNTKTTYPSLIGLEKSRELAKHHIEAACSAIQRYDGPPSLFLRNLAYYILERAN